MTVNVEKKPEGYEVHIDGTIKSVADSQSIKDAVGGCEDSKLPIHIRIDNSFSVTSSVIGFMLKKVQADKADVRITVSDERLYDLFKSLNLATILNVHKA
jgi:hypothetical protein